MDAREKRRLELDRQIKKRREEIMDAAVAEFTDKGIDSAKITDIAKRAEVGPATVYRYFETKPQLVIECAIRLWRDELLSLMPRHHDRLNGFERVQELLSSLGALYEKCPVLLRLLEQFDNYIVRERIPKDRLQEYEACILDMRALMLEAIRAGCKDGSIRPDIDAALFYATTTHALVALCQKLLLRGDVLQSDREVDAQAEISLLIDMELEYFKGQAGCLKDTSGAF